MNEHTRQAVEALLAEMRQRSDEAHKIRLTMIQLAVEENERMAELGKALLEIVGVRK